MLRIRPALPEDREWVFELANDPVVRQWSLNSAPIPWESHVVWYARRMEPGQESMVLLLEDETGRVGWVRFDVQGETGFIGIALVEAARGKGYSVPGMNLGLDQFFERYPARDVRAQVRHDNHPTEAMLRRVGFEEIRGEVPNQSEWRISASSRPQASG